MYAPLPFDNIGGFKYNAPRSNNNNPLKNPLIFPRTRTNQAQCEKQVCNYLVQMGQIKIFLSLLLSSY